MADWTPIKRADGVPEIDDNPPSPGRVTVTIQLNETPTAEWIKAFLGTFQEPTVVLSLMEGWTEPVVRGKTIRWTPMQTDVIDGVKAMDE
jgi:hypothetical protein